MRKFNTIPSKLFNNLEEEDIETFYDANSVVDDLSDLSDTFSDPDICTEENVNKKLDIDSEIVKQTYWFCKLLVLWQCIHYVLMLLLPFF